MECGGGAAQRRHRYGCPRNSSALSLVSAVQFRGQPKQRLRWAAPPPHSIWPVGLRIISRNYIEGEGVRAFARFGCALGVAKVKERFGEPQMNQRVFGVVL